MIALVFDTETTALTVNSLRKIGDQPKIIEYCGALVDTESGEDYDWYDAFINPGAPLSDEVRRITHISDEDLNGAPIFASVAPRIIGQMAACGAVVAHNLAFDYAVMEYEFKRNELAPRWPPIRICTVENTEHLLGYRLSLSALHEYLFSETFPEAHRAINDVKALVRCFKELVKRGEI